MAVTRRDLLRLGPVLVAATAMPPRVSAQSAVDPLASLRRESFEPCVNSSFEAADGKGARVWLTLMAVQDQSSQVAAANRGAWASLSKRPSAAPSRMDVFTLTFYGPPNLKQDTYALNHPRLGNFSLLLVPSGAQSYVAVINRLVGPPPQA